MVTVQASKELLSLAEDWADSRIKSADLVPKMIAQAEKEGLAASDCRELLETLLKRRGLSDGHIRRLIPEEFKRTYSRDSESRNMRDVEHSAKNEEDISKLQEQFEAVKSEVKELRSLLVPFKTGTVIEFRGNRLPLIIEVDPQSRKVLYVEVNETEARRINQ